MRAGLRAVLSVDETIIVDEAADGREAVERTSRHKPDVVLMDVRMPNLDGIALTQIVVNRKSRILILTTFEDDDHVFGALSAVRQDSSSNAPSPNSSRRDTHDRRGRVLAVPVGNAHGDRQHGAPPPTRSKRLGRLHNLTPRERAISNLSPADYPTPKSPRLSWSRSPPSRRT